MCDVDRFSFFENLIERKKKQVDSSYPVSWSLLIHFRSYVVLEMVFDVLLCNNP